MVAEFYIAGIILFQDDLLNQSETKSQQETVKIAIKNHDKMWNESSVPWWVCFYSNSHLMVKIMLHAKYEPFEKAVFNNSSLNSTVYLSEDDINKIVNYAKQFADN